MAPLLQSSSRIISGIRHPHTLRSLLPLLHDFAPRSLSANSPLQPTRTVPAFDNIPRSLASFFRRQGVVTVTATAPPQSTTTPLIPTTYSGLNAGPPPGTVVGIVFGSVAGFLLLLWLIYTCFGMGGAIGSSEVVEREEIVEERRHSRTRSSARRSSPRRPPSSHSASEVIEIEGRRERTPPRRESLRRERETVIIEETRRSSRPPEDDYVEVIEEHSPVRREGSRRKVSGGYRVVDPEAFAGGDRPMRKVSSRR
ncbi:hypothetical protein N7G274_004803 [Stereocaulon virgatum]|uniref:Uncharacterized protein n=1 Tax=Stereocaulon virgatum TaxID=373712 RepID=A0ABR4A8U7_9LECA